MTKEEAIEILNNWSPWQEIGDYDRFRDALDMAIKALKQEPILDKIRAEIGELNPVDYGSIYSYESHNGARYMKDDVLYIIDKYKAESEE